jgi:Fur family ferric uptake transcriptional regulator
MHPSQSLLKQVLQDHQYSLTRARALVAQLLWQQKPLTVRQLVELVDGRIDRASIYRTIKLFEELGIVQRVNLGWKYQIELTGPFSHHHHHLTCLQCHQVIVVTDPSLEKLMSKIAHQHGFNTQQHQVEIQGYCQDCSKESVARSAEVGS